MMNNEGASAQRTTLELLIVAAPMPAAPPPAEFDAPFGAPVPTKIDPTDGTIRVYDPETNTFGSYNADGTTRTLYKPDPGRHGYDSTWQYWDDQQGNSPSILGGRSIG